MKCYILFLAAMAIALPCIAQRIRFETTPIAEAFDHARQEGKPLYVELTTDWCKPCLERQQRIFVDPAVSYLLNHSFACKLVNAERGEGFAFARNYKVTSFPAFLVFAPSGDLTYRFAGAAATTASYLEEVNKGLEATKSTETISYLMRLFDKGKATKTQMSLLVAKAAELKTDPDQVQEVAEAYYQSLSPQERVSAKVMLPLAQTLLYVNRPAYPQLMAMLPGLRKAAGTYAPELCASLKDAIRFSIEKEIVGADQFEHLLGDVQALNETFTRGTMEETELDWLTIRLAYARTGAKNVLEHRAEAYVAKYLWIPPDELKKKDELLWNSQKGDYNPAYVNNTALTTPAALPSRHRACYSFTTARHLNDLAWGYFLIQSPETDLNQALKWAERACKLYPHPNMLDTRANLLFALGQTKPAVELQRQALAQMRKMGGDTTEIYDSLKRMMAAGAKANATMQKKKG